MSESVKKNVTIGETIIDAIKPIGVIVPKIEMLMGVVAICAPADAERESETTVGKYRDNIDVRGVLSNKMPANAP